MLSRFIEQLCSELEIEAKLSDEKNYTLFFEPNLEILLRENPDSGITFFTKLASVPEQAKEDFFLKALSANLFGKETGGCVLGVSNDETSVLLRALVQTSNYKHFKETLEDFTNYAEVWRDEVLVKE